MKKERYNSINRREVYIKLIDDHKCVFLNDIVIKKFDIIADDYAYTNSRHFANKIRSCPIEEIHNSYPECFI